MQDSYATTPTHTKHIKFKFIRNVSTVADQKIERPKSDTFLENSHNSGKI